MNTIIKPFDKLTTKELFHIYKLRVDVFVVEQQCPYHEIDDIDLISHHIYLSWLTVDCTNKMIHSTSDE